ncbi:MAG: transcription elongation factor GreA [Clostridiales bacterium]|jgi:transcription elongation factor GreA|nr:transcription elongation factor GreA [Clostridiales bacterium]
MYDELTQVDIDKMREEIEYRTKVLRPKVIEEVRAARSFGDLSENFEYRAAKQEKNRNESRIRYLERMIKTAKIVSGESKPDEVGLFDTVELYFEEDDETQTIRLMTTLRQDALSGIISPKSPLGKAIMGRRTGDRVRVEVNPEYSYHVVIRSIQKGEDDASLPISTY